VRLGAAVLALALLSGCDALNEARGVRTFALLDGAVHARGPDGFCVDPAASRPDAGFAAMGSCALMSAIALMPQTAGLITVQFGAPASASVVGNEDAVEALLRSVQGAGLLSSSGRPEAIVVSGIDNTPGIVTVRFRDGAPPLAEGLEQTELRAFLDIRGPLATVTVRGLTRAPMTEGRGSDLIAQAVSALRAANPTGAGDATASAAATP